MLFQTNPDFVWGLITSMYLGNLMLLLMNLFTIPAFVAVLRVPYTILMGLIVVFSTVGAYSANNNLFDIWMMLGLGVLGYLMKKLDYPVVPLILALVLGKLAENSSGNRSRCPAAACPFSLRVPLRRRSLPLR